MQQAVLLRSFSNIIFTMGSLMLMGCIRQLVMGFLINQFKPDLWRIYIRPNLCQIYTAFSQMSRAPTLINPLMRISDRRRF